MAVVHDTESNTELCRVPGQTFLALFTLSRCALLGYPCGNIGPNSFSNEAGLRPWAADVWDLDGQFCIRTVAWRCEDPQLTLDDTFVHGLYRRKLWGRSDYCIEGHSFNMLGRAANGSDDTPDIQHLGQFSVWQSSPCECNAAIIYVLPRWNHAEKYGIAIVRLSVSR